ncbi:MAG: 4-vinyl reductase [Anaerolineales bacterium]|nr:4-vinyl reductase [Anaerolineales bacterium]
MEQPSAAHSPEYYYPNKMVRIILLAMEEVMGRNGVNAVLNLAQLKHLVNNFPPNNFDRQVTFSDLGALMRSLDEMYGPRGGRGLALRAGRACFKYGLKEFGPVLGIADLAFRLLPLHMKLKVGAGVFAETFNKFSDQVVHLGETEEQFLWEIQRCPVCWDRHAETPCCFLAVGILQEALYWVSGGKNFEVSETACVACGAGSCLIVIEKNPLD